MFSIVVCFVRLFVHSFSFFLSRSTLAFPYLSVPERRASS